MAPEDAIIACCMEHKNISVMVRAKQTLLLDVFFEWIGDWLIGITKDCDLSAPGLRYRQGDNNKNETWLNKPVTSYPPNHNTTMSIHPSIQCSRCMIKPATQVAPNTLVQIIYASLSLRWCHEIENSLRDSRLQHWALQSQTQYQNHLLPKISSCKDHSWSHMKPQPPHQTDLRFLIKYDQRTAQWNFMLKMLPSAPIATV